MENLDSAVQTLIHGSNTLFILIGAVMVLAMHCLLYTSDAADE